MHELIYEHWHFPRPRLAQSYLTLLRGGSGDPICLQAPRRLGKTTFLLIEVIPAAIKAGYLPVYVDVWQHRSDPMAAINYGLQEAIDNIEVPQSTLGKRLKTKVNKVGIGSASIDLGDEPARRRPEAPFLLVDFLQGLRSSDIYRIQSRSAARVIQPLSCGAVRRRQYVVVPRTRRRIF